MHHWLAKRGLVPVTFSSSEVSLFVNYCKAHDDLPFFLEYCIDLPLTLWCEGSEVNELLTGIYACRDLIHFFLNANV